MRRRHRVAGLLTAGLLLVVPAVPAIADPSTPSSTPTTTAPTSPPASGTPTATPTTTGPASKGIPATFLAQLQEFQSEATGLQSQLVALQTQAGTAIATYNQTTQAVQSTLASAQQAQDQLAAANDDVAAARKQVQIFARDAYIERVPHTSSALLLTSNPDDFDFAVAALGYLADRGDSIYARYTAAQQRASTLAGQQQAALDRAKTLQATADTQRAQALNALGQVQSQQQTFVTSVTALRDKAAAAAGAAPLSPADTAAYQDFLAQVNALLAGVGTSGTTYVPGGPGLTPLPGTLWVKPLTQYTISSCYCARWGTFHHGVDLAAPAGTPIYAVGAGTVVAAGPANGFGNWVVIDHHDGSFSIYGHMRVLATVVGTQVQPGTLIAYVGSEGESTGPHLHFEVRLGSYAEPSSSTDPTLWLAQRGVTL